MSTELRLSQVGETLFEVATILTSSSSLEELLAGLARVAAQSLGLQGATVWSYEQETDFLQVEAVYGFDPSYREWVAGLASRRTGDSAIERVMRGKCVVAVEDIQRVPGYDAYRAEIQQRFGWRACLVAPFIYQEGATGGLAVYSREPRGWTKAERRFLEGLGRYAAVAIENSRMAERLRRAKEQLEAQVAERTRELREAQTDLIRKERLAVVGELIGRVAHEVRSPLHEVGMGVSLLKARLAADPQVLNTISQIDQQVVRVASLVRELSDYSQPLSLSLVRRDPTVLVRERAQDLADFLAGHGASLSVRVIGPVPAVPFDPMRLGQVLDNLIMNAVEAYEPGAADPSVTVELQAAAGGVEVRVLDHGRGIPAELLPRVLLPFFTTKDTGTGLGLAIADRIVRMHGGRMRLESYPGRGTKAKVFLPGPEGSA